VLLDEPFYRVVIEEPKHKEKQPTWAESSEHQTEKWLDNDSTPDPPKPMKNSRKLAGLETSHANAWMPPAEGSHRNRGGKNKSAKSAELALEDVESEDMIPIYAAVEISDNYKDGIDDPESYQVETESPLTQ